MLGTVLDIRVAVVCTTEKFQPRGASQRKALSSAALNSSCMFSSFVSSFSICHLLKIWIL